MTRANRFSIIIFIFVISLFFLLMKVKGFTYKDLVVQLVGVKPEITNAPVADDNTLILSEVRNSKIYNHSRFLDDINPHSYLPPR